jgi:hypothetical protein
MLLIGITYQEIPQQSLPDAETYDYLHLKCRFRPEDEDSKFIRNVFIYSGRKIIAIFTDI